METEEANTNFKINNKTAEKFFKNLKKH
jgi:hypothetical protein